MKIRKIAFFPFILASLLLSVACDQQTSGSGVAADSSRLAFEPYSNDVEYGDYRIHINALTTDQLPAEVARGYKISRSKHRALMNIAIREKQADGELPVTADVNVLAKNLSNQIKNVKLRKIKEADPLAIYYIGELPVSNEEIITFDVDVTPTGESEPILLSYRQQFFTE